MEYQTNTYPDEHATNSEKENIEYGKKIALIIDDQWFSGGITRRRLWIDEMRQYARGEQDTSKYKKIIEGEKKQSQKDGIKTHKIVYEPLKVMSTFKDILTNAIDESLFKPRAEAIDRVSINRKKNYYSKIDEDFYTKDLAKVVSKSIGVDIQNKNTPKDERELKIRKIEFKPAIELAQELFVDNVMKSERFEVIKDKVDEDLVDLGIGVVRHYTDVTEGIKLEYVDPYNYIHNDFEMDDGRDIRYHAVVKRGTIAELIKKSKGISENDLLLIKNKAINDYKSSVPYEEEIDAHRMVEYIEFAYLVTKKRVFKKRFRNGVPVKLIDRSDDSNGEYNPKNKERRLSIPYQIWYEGVYVPNAKVMLKWEEIPNQAEGYINKPISPFIVYAPKVKKLSEKGSVRFDSLILRAKPIIDDLHRDYYKFQQLKNELRPNTVTISPRVLENTLLNGKKVNSEDLLNLYFGRGVLLADEYDEDGEKVGSAIQEKGGGINNSSLMFLSSEFLNHYNRLRQLIGVNELRDGTTKPNSKTSVTVQKLLLASSNNATNHIVKASFNISLQIAECVSARLYDVMTTKALKDRYIDVIGTDNVELLDELKNYPMSKFAIYFDFKPDNEERNEFERSLIQSYSNQEINVAQYNQARMIRNVKSAIKYLEYVIDENTKRIEEQKRANIKANAEANAQTSVITEQTKQQTLTIKYETKKQELLLQSEIRSQEKKEQAQIDELRDIEKHKRKMEELRLELEIKAQIEKSKEDAKDKRLDQQATNQSVLIDQRKNNKEPKNFFNKLTDIFSDNPLLSKKQ